MYRKILESPLVFGDDISSQAQSILTGLLTRDPTQRLGVNGAEEIRKHPFFAKNIDFNKLLKKQIQPPFKPSVASPVVSVHSSSWECDETELWTGCFELRYGVHY